MIRVTKLDGKSIMLNADWIRTVEKTPDTLITLTTGFQMIVRDSLEDVVNAFHRYKQQSSGIEVKKVREAS